MFSLSPLFHWSEEFFHFFLFSKLLFLFSNYFYLLLVLIDIVWDRAISQGQPAHA